MPENNVLLPIQFSLVTHISNSKVNGSPWIISLLGGTFSVEKKNHYIIKAGDSRATRTLVLSISSIQHCQSVFFFLFFFFFLERGAIPIQK